MMIRRALGCTFGSCVMVLAGASALSAGGYMTMTGKTVCSMIQGCGEKANSAENKKVTTIAAKEGGAKSCCPLGKTVAAKSSDCSKTAAGEATVVQASAKSSGCSQTAAGEAKVVATSAKSKDCSKPCTGEAKVVEASAKSKDCSKPCTGEGKVVEASAKSSDCAKACAAGKVASAKRGFFMMSGSAPVAMPAMFYNSKAGFCAASLKEVGGCNTPCSSEAKVATVAATETSGCGEVKTAAVSTVAAKEGTPAGCCKGTGARADGTPCQKDGPKCDQGAKTAEGQAEKAPEAAKTGEPVTSRQ